MKSLLIIAFTVIVVNTTQGQSHIKMRFTASDPSFEPAAKEYSRIWAEEGDKIVATMEKLSGMKFLDTAIAVIIYEAPSNSGDSVKAPMKLRASYSYDIKRATIVHELGHRLDFFIHHFPRNFNDHNLLFLYLYDVWTELYGEKFANDMVQVEFTRSNPANDYKGMWQAALAMSKEERKKELEEFIRAHR